MLVDLAELAERLDADEKIQLTYKFPVSPGDGIVEYEVRQGKLLDVATDAQLLYVSHEAEVIWIKPEEVVAVSPEGTQ